MSTPNSRGSRDAGAVRIDAYRGRSIERSSSGTRQAQSTSGVKAAESAKKPSAQSSRAPQKAATYKAGASKTAASKAVTSKAAAAKASASKAAASKTAVSKGAAKTTASKTAASNAARSKTAQRLSASGAASGSASSKTAVKRPVSKTAASKTASPAAKGAKASPGMKSAQQTGRANTTAQRQAAKKTAQNAAGKKQPSSAEKQQAPTAPAKNHRFDQQVYSAVYFVSIAAFFFCVAVVLSMSVLFHIQDIVVESDDELPYSEEEIIEASGISVGNNLLAISKRKAEENIPFTLPYIEKVEIVREMPSTVHIKVEKAVPMGLVLNTEKQLVVVSMGGRALEVLRGSNPDNIPIINGLILNKTVLGRKAEFEKPEQFETAIKVVDVFREYELEPDSVSFSPTGNIISAEYDRRINIRIGTVNGLEEKVELAATLIKQEKILPTEAGMLDLSTRGKATFRPDYVEQENASLISHIYESRPSSTDLPYEVLEVRREETMAVSDSSVETP